MRTRLPGYSAHVSPQYAYIPHRISQSCCYHRRRSSSHQMKLQIASKPQPTWATRWVGVMLQIVRCELPATLKSQTARVTAQLWVHRNDVLQRKREYMQKENVERQCLTFFTSSSLLSKAEQTGQLHIGGGGGGGGGVTGFEHSAWCFVQSSRYAYFLHF